MDQKQTVVKIRHTHEKLRKQLANGNNFEEIWENHCKDVKMLQEYSEAMETLATKVWDVDCDGTDRTKWCKEVCLNYYQKGGLSKHLKKDTRRKEHYTKEEFHFHCGPTPYLSFETAINKDMDRNFNRKSKIRLLDVGSCYNPFKGADEFDATPIDLFPAHDNVYKCDFLKVAIGETLATCLDRDTVSEEAPPTKRLQYSNCFSTITTLPYCFYHAVVFSLLLTYIPCPHKRWDMCEKAHRLLVTNGLLLIVTPDSCHQNRHAALMKSWKDSIESIGFQRVIYSKDTHLHLMVFRKVPCDFIWDKRKYKANVEDVKKLLNIPQDFHVVKENDDTQE